jgi:hypothetical protein
MKQILRCLSASHIGSSNLAGYQFPNLGVTGSNPVGVASNINDLMSLLVPQENRGGTPAERSFGSPGWLV